MKISNRDWAQLSAYLDGELSQRDLARMEDRIKRDPGLQAALEDLKGVKAVLAQTPRLAAPRDFRLEPSLVQKKSRQVRAPLPVYRLAAAALSILFVGVVVLDLGSVVMKGGLSASQAPLAEEVMLEAAADAMEEPEMMAMEEAVEESAPAAEMEEAPLASEYDGQPEEGETVGMGEPDAKVTGEDAERSLDEGDDVDLEESQNALAEDEGLIPEATEMPLERDSDWSAEPLRIPWLRVLEIIFGLGAIGFGIAAWRRRA